jgi:hypothetical protein
MKTIILAINLLMIESYIGGRLKCKNKYSAINLLMIGYKHYENNYIGGK